MPHTQDLLDSVENVPVSLRNAQCNFITVVARYIKDDAHFDTNSCLNDQPEAGIDENHIGSDGVREIHRHLNNRPAAFGGRFVLPWTGAGEEPADRKFLREQLLHAMRWHNDTHKSQLVCTADGLVVFRE